MNPRQKQSEIRARESWGVPLSSPSVDNVIHGHSTIVRNKSEDRIPSPRSAVLPLRHPEGPGLPVSRITDCPSAASRSRSCSLQESREKEKCLIIPKLYHVLCPTPPQNVICSSVLTSPSPGLLHILGLRHSFSLWQVHRTSWEHPVD